MAHYPHRRAQWHSLGFLTGAISSTKLHPVCAHPVCAHHQSFLLAPPGHLTVTVPTTGLGTREGPGSGPTTGPSPGCRSSHISCPLSGLRRGPPSPHDQTGPTETHSHHTSWSHTHREKLVRGADWAARSSERLVTSTQHTAPLLPQTGSCQCPQGTRRQWPLGSWGPTLHLARWPQAQWAHSI